MKIPKKKIEQLKKKYEQKLLFLPNVVGVGIGYKETKNISTERLCLKVYVKKKIPESQLRREHLIPKKIENIETDVEEIGTLKGL